MCKLHISPERWFYGVTATLQALLERMEGLELVPPTLLRSARDVRRPCLLSASIVIWNDGWGTCQPDCCCRSTNMQAVHQLLLSCRPAMPRCA